MPRLQPTCAGPCQPVQMWPRSPRCRHGHGRYTRRRATAFSWRKWPPRCWWLRPRRPCGLLRADRRRRRHAAMRCESRARSGPRRSSRAPSPRRTVWSRTRLRWQPLPYRLFPPPPRRRPRPPPTPPCRSRISSPAISPTVVVIETSTGSGSGVFVRPDTIVTNAHVAGLGPHVSRPASLRAIR